MKIYVVERSSGEHSDYRTTPVAYSTDKNKSEAFAKAAAEEALTLRFKYEKMWQPIWNLETMVSTEEYDKLEKRTKKLKSKFDPELDAYSFYSASYAVIEIEEIT